MTSATSHPSPHTIDRSLLTKLTIGCIGIVYGDIGTSPLYAFREAVRHASSGADGLLPLEIYGILSLIFWALIINVTVKYVMFLLYIDNRGEGGNLSLVALARKGVSSGWSRVVLLLGIIGAGLFTGDAVITPAISVFSAIEGLKLITPAFNDFILPMTVLILVGIFAVQRKGTTKVAVFFGPLMTAWFLVMGGLGLSHIIQLPEVLKALNPYYGLYFIAHHGWLSLSVIGSVFLAVTGVEALYVDLGHFGRRPIQYAWLGLALPCLALNYAGQAAALLQDPAVIKNPFFLMAPSWGLLPLVIMATMATTIASQAVITGAFSLAQQAMHLGLLPRLEVRHTSAEQEGQVYMPRVNNLLLLAVLLLCVVFRSSSALASAYGIAVTATMMITSVLAFIVIWKVLGRSLLNALLWTLPFAMIELVYLCSNLAKVIDGGYVTLGVAALIVLVMTTWIKGSRYLYARARQRAVSLTDLLEMLDRDPPQRIEGTAIFLTSDPQTAPMALLQNIKHNKILHSHNVVLTIVTAHTPKVPEDQRLVIDTISSFMSRIIISYGYMETPDVPRALALARRQGFEIDLKEASYFLGRRSFIAGAHSRMPDKLGQAWKNETVDQHAARVAVPDSLPPWRNKIYIALADSAVTATDFYRIPRSHVVEMGIQISL